MMVKYGNGECNTFQAEIQCSPRILGASERKIQIQMKIIKSFDVGAVRCIVKDHVKDFK